MLSDLLLLGVLFQLGNEVPAASRVLHTSLAFTSLDYSYSLIELLHRGFRVFVHRCIFFRLLIRNSSSNPLQHLLAWHRSAFDEFDMPYDLTIMGMVRLVDSRVSAFCILAARCYGGFSLRVQPFVIPLSLCPRFVDGFS